MTPRIAMIGCGKMGGALLKKWVTSNLNFDFTVFKPSPFDDPNLKNNVTHKTSTKGESSFDIIILGVKPQVMSEVIEEYRQLVNNNTLILTIAAGLPLSWYEDKFSSAQPIIRTMPNTPVEIGKGVTIAVANEATATQHKTWAEKLFAPTGLFQWLEHEDMLTTATTISGCGPAYLFYFIEALSKAGTNAGLPKSVAIELARQTVIGSAALTEAESSVDVQELRKNVTSKHGVTEAALNVLMDGRLEDIMTDAISAAIIRSQELSS